MTLLTVVTDRSRTPGDLAALCVAAARAGADRIQVREKDLDGGALLGLVRAVVVGVADTRARVLVSARPDVAALAGAHGVQLPEDGLPVAEVKRAFPELLVGASRHDVAGACEAGAAGADFVLLGPVFPTPGKEARALGAAVLAEAVRLAGVPVHAIGGIEPRNVAQALAAGAAGVAGIRPFLVDPAAAVRAFRKVPGRW